MIRNLKLFLWFLALVALSSCTQNDLYEKLNNISGGAWARADVQRYELDISDSTRPYHIFVVIRHQHNYAYRNLWVNLGMQSPGDSAMTTQPFELQLAAADKWLGTGMADVYERRILLFPRPVQFPRTGKIIFTLQQNMRVDPLPGILQAGIRVEPVPAMNPGNER